jgi:hypothetical protein
MQTHLVHYNEANQHKSPLVKIHSTVSLQQPSEFLLLQDFGESMSIFFCFEITSELRFAKSWGETDSARVSFSQKLQHLSQHTTQWNDKTQVSASPTLQMAAPQLHKTFRWARG